MGSKKLTSLGPAMTFMGDSKTADSGLSFQNALISSLQTQLPGLFLYPPQRATGGFKVADLDASADAWVNTYATPVDKNLAVQYVLINIGINDITAGTSQASFEASLGSLLDKVHAGFQNAKLYVALVWGRNHDAACDAMDNTWIPNVLSSRSSFAFVGFDERATLKGGDNGVTNTLDGVHPNATGYSAMAVAWKAALGF